MSASVPFVEAPWASKPTVTLEDVGATRGEVTILRAVTARIPHGACTAIIGPNGAGKTTLLRCLLGLLPHTGTITRRFQRLGYVPQRLALDRSLPLTAEEALTIAVSDRPIFLGLSKAHRERARALLAEVCADHLAQRPLGGLSGGELQRVMLAQALGREPDLLVLDEPGTGLDTHGHRLCCDLTADARKRRGITPGHGQPRPRHRRRPCGPCDPPRPHGDPPGTTGRGAGPRGPRPGLRPPWSPRMSLGLRARWDRVGTFRRPASRLGQRP